MSGTNKHLLYQTDLQKLIHIRINFHDNTQGIDYRKRLSDGSFNDNDILHCSSPTKKLFIKPRYVMFNYGTHSNPIKLKIIFKTQEAFINFIINNSDYIYHYKGEYVNPNKLIIINPNN